MSTLLLLGGIVAASVALLAAAIVLSSRDPSPIDHVFRHGSRWAAIAAILMLGAGLASRFIAWVSPGR